MEKVISKIAIQTEKGQKWSPELIYVVKVFVDFENPINTRYRYYKIDERYSKYTLKNYTSFSTYSDWVSSVSRAEKKYGNATKDVRNNWALEQ